VLARTSLLLSNIPDAREVLTLARHIGTLGFGRVWLSENNVLDAASLAGAIAAQTELEVGTAIVPVYSRTPALLAMTAATVSRIGGGRPFHLGIGAGGKVTVERWHGVPFTQTVQTVEDTLEIVRQALGGMRTGYDGAGRRSSGFRIVDGPPFSARLYVGGMGPGMQQLAARKADGLIVTWLSPRITAGLRRDLDTAARAAGRDPAAVELVARAYVGVCDDPAAAREAVRKEMVEYLVSPPYGRYFSAVGFSAEVSAVCAAFAARDRAGAVAAVSDRLLDEMLIVGRDAADIAAPLRAYFESGADHLLIQPVPDHRHGDPARTIDAVAQALRA
jgi:probable F420-dependent oxidoreductase